MKKLSTIIAIVCITFFANISAEAAAPGCCAKGSKASTALKAHVCNDDCAPGKCNIKHGEVGHKCTTDCAPKTSSLKAHVCNDQCAPGKCNIKHGEVGHKCTTACKS